MQTITRKQKIMIQGAVIVLASLWLGAYFISIADGSWAEFPVLITSIAGIIGGYGLAAYGFIEVDD